MFAQLGEQLLVWLLPERVLEHLWGTWFFGASSFQHLVSEHL